MLNKNSLSILCLFLSTATHASCIGSSNIYTCNDASGNSYNVQKFGNTTNMQGYNSQTGSNWTQNSNTFGNTTVIQGQSNGSNWNQTIQRFPGMTIQSGTDSQGNSFSRTCTAYGCY